MKHTLNISIEQEQYEKLRKISFNSRKSISQVIREAIDKLLEERKQDWQLPIRKRIETDKVISYRLKIL